jgi:hypothetical protein
MAEGIKTAYVKTPDGKVIEIGDHSHLGITKADFKGMSGNLSNIVASNEIQYTYAEPAKPTLTLTAVRAGSKLIAALTGKKKAGNSNLYVDGDTLPIVGVAVVTPNIGRDSDHLYVMPKCRASVQSVSLSTNTDSKRTMVYDQITFNANYDDEIGGLMADGDIETGSAATELQAFGWSAPVQGDGDFKDDKSDSSAKPVASSTH